jgi:excisionase family DNA binding protein
MGDGALKPDALSVSVPISHTVTQIDNGRWLSVREAATYIRGTNWFVETLCRSKQIPYKRNGKKFVIDRQDLDRYMESGKTAVAA